MGDFTIQRITANQSAGLTTGVDGSPTSTASYPKYSYYNFYYFDLDKKWKGSDTYTNHVSVQ